MIDFARDVRYALFNGDIDEPVIVSNVSVDDVTIRGIFGYQTENPQIENVIISDAKKLTLALSTSEIVEKEVLITRSTVFTFPQRANDTYMPIVDPIDNFRGLVTVIIGKCES